MSILYFSKWLGSALSTPALRDDLSHTNTRLCFDGVTLKGAPKYVGDGLSQNPVFFHKCGSVQAPGNSQSRHVFTTNATQCEAIQSMLVKMMRTEMKHTPSQMDRFAHPDQREVGMKLSMEYYPNVEEQGAEPGSEPWVRTITFRRDAQNKFRFLRIEGSDATPTNAVSCGSLVYQRGGSAGSARQDLPYATRYKVYIMGDSGDLCSEIKSFIIAAGQADASTKKNELKTVFNGKVTEFPWTQFSD